VSNILAVLAENSGGEDERLKVAVEKLQEPEEDVQLSVLRSAFASSQAFTVGQDHGWQISSISTTLSACCRPGAKRRHFFSVVIAGLQVAEDHVSSRNAVLFDFFFGADGDSLQLIRDALRANLVMFLPKKAISSRNLVRVQGAPVELSSLNETKGNTK
jgi:hypothetical protein